MKKLTLVCLLSFIIYNTTFSQCQYGDKSNSPEELFRKRLRPDGMRYGNPYTMFVKGDDFNLNTTLGKIKENILSGEPIVLEKFRNDYAQLYYQIYTSVTGNNSSEPDRCQKLMEDQTCAHPAWVKNNAIIYLVGLKYEVIGGVGKFTEFTNPSDREAFATKAYEGLQKLNPEVNLCTFGGDFDRHLWTLGAQERCGKIRVKAAELMQYLQAYDLLKAGGKILPYDQDRNMGNCQPRNKLRQFSRNLYANSGAIINSSSGWKKNHGIICASALGMAAIVLNDAGVEITYIDIISTNFLSNLINTIINIIDRPVPHPKFSPLKWYDRATGSNYGRTVIDLMFDIILGKWFVTEEGGLEDNFFIGRHTLLFNPVPQSSPDGKSGYAEGPGYFTDLNQVMLPFFRTADNFLQVNNSLNYLHQERYLNILRWYNNILNHDGSQPTYDNTALNGGSFLSILGVDEFKNTGIDYIPTGGIDLRGDYLFAFGGKNPKVSPSEKYNNSESGNIILYNKTDQAEYTFHMLAETDYAIDKDANFWEGSHEEKDLGSFMIFAGDKGKKAIPLAIDPPYLGWSENEYTSKYWMHNTIEIDNGDEAKNRHYLYPKPATIKNDITNRIREFNLNFDFKDDDHHLYSGIITRNVNQNINKEKIYYVINDFVDATNVAGDFQEIKLNLNGNGRHIPIGSFPSRPTYEENTYKRDEIEKTSIWDFPCNQADGWKLIAHVTAKNASSSGSDLWYSALNSDVENNSTLAKDIGAENQLTRASFHQPKRKTIFQSFLYPIRCTELPPLIHPHDGNTQYIATSINFIDKYDISLGKSLYKDAPENIDSLVNDTSSHFHYARFNGMEADSVQNPFNLPNQSDKWVQLDAQKAFLRYQTMAMAHGGFKYCPPSYLNLRYTSITNGSYVKFNDTFLIKATIPINAALGFSGRYLYNGNIKAVGTPSATDSVSFYLAEVGKGVDMVALDYLTRKEIGCRYDSFTNIITIQIPEDYTNITIEEREKCNDCYFPPTSMGIDTLFTIDDGSTHTLGHKLSIKQGNGNLHLTKGSRIEMCPEVYIRNRDTLIIEGPDQNKGLELPTCDGIDSLKAKSNNSAIIVNAGSALVLDDGSYTYIKSGGAIYVKQSGSLVIKDGAFVQIGDSGTIGWGEIVAEQGAFIHIEPNAHIEYKSVIGDTTDRNIFMLGGGINNVAYHGIYFLVDTVLKLDTVMPIHYTSTAICALDTVNPVKNKYWGYSNFAKPLATFTARNDTLCPKEPLHIKLNRILNDAQAQIKVCRMDSMFISPEGGGTPYWQDTCIEDSIVIDLIPPDPVCKPPRQMPDEWTYYFKPNTLNRVTISAVNDCGMRHDTIAYIYASDTPRFYIDVPDSVCEGFSPLAIRLYDYNPIPVKYSIAITEFFTDSQSLALGLNKPAPIYSADGFGLLPDSIVVSDYFFTGGRKYLVSLTIQNECLSFDAYDTVSVPSGVLIKLSRPTVYANPINGATSVQLNGYISIADSFRWEPTTWLNRTDTNVVISTPENAINYVLIAKYGECTSTDTAYIKYNRVANAGINDTLCFTNDTALLGNSYDMSIFLGFMYYTGGTDFYNLYQPYTSTDPAYFRYFTHFMMHDEKVLQWLECGTPVMDKFRDQVLRRQIIKQPWFKEYYTELTKFTDPDMGAFDLFVNGINSNYTLSSNMDEQGDWNEFSNCMEAVFDYYGQFVSDQLNEVSSTWTKIVNEDTTTLTAWNEYFVITDNPVQTTTYIQNVITPQYAEIDEVTIYRDTLLVPIFVPVLQWDSTVYLANYTHPFSEATTYSWDFGDGSEESTDINPIHTFPAFNESYIVCLTATNKCGNYIYCDTVHIDSAHLTNGNMVFVPSNVKTEINNSNKQQLNAKVSLPNIGGTSLINYPNPFDGSTIINYQILKAYSNAELRVTNVLGQEVYSQKLNKPIDNITLNGYNLQSGLYYYSLIIDGRAEQTKIMSVMH